MQNSQHLNNPTQATQSNIQIEDILVMSEIKQQGAYKSNGSFQLFSILPILAIARSKATYEK